MNETHCRFLVLADDDGIRPAGKPDRCFYCHRPIGQLHAADCVTIVKDVAYDVRVLGQKVGVWTCPAPFFWTAHDCEFHKNESSWCANNALGEIEWLETETAGWTAMQIEALLQKGDCVCNLLEFQYVSEGKEARRSGG